MKIVRFVSQSLVFVWSISTSAIPRIDAHRFESTPVEISSSGRVYRFSIREGEVPRVGNIVLIEENKQPTMAFRVIRNHASKKEYFAQRVRRYDQQETLILNRSYSSLEKIAERVDGPPLQQSAPLASNDPILENPTEKITENITEKPQPLIAEVPIAESALTPEPTVATPPVPSATETLEAPQTLLTENPLAENSPADPAVNEVDESLDQTLEDLPVNDQFLSSIEVQEEVRLQPLNSMLFIQSGSFRNNSGFSMSRSPFSAVSLSFSKKLRDDWLFHQKKTQDALWFELGAAYYTNVELTNDLYRLLPFRAELRWEIYFSPTFGIQFYGGIQYNWLFASENSPQTRVIDALSGFQTNVGTGLFFQIGPQWYLRSDLGLDRLSAGLGIRW